jgi:hypothetical protein
MRKKYDTQFKAKIALEAVRGEKRIHEISNLYSTHPNMATPLFAAPPKPSSASLRPVSPFAVHLRCLAISAAGNMLLPDPCSDPGVSKGPSSPVFFPCHPKIEQSPLKTAKNEFFCRF